MAVTVGDVMRHVKNYFHGEPEEVSLEGGHFPAHFLGGWVAIADPPALRGVWQVTEDDLPLGADRVTVYPLYPTGDFLRLCKEIDDWSKTHPPTDLSLEHRGSVTERRQGSVSDWQRVFALRLAPYRRMFTEVEG